MVYELIYKKIQPSLNQISLNIFNIAIPFEKIDVSILLKKETHNKMIQNGKLELIHKSKANYKAYLNLEEEIRTISGLHLLRANNERGLFHDLRIFINEEYNLNYYYLFLDSLVHEIGHSIESHYRYCPKDEAILLFNLAKEYDNILRGYKKLKPFNLESLFEGIIINDFVYDPEGNINSIETSSNINLIDNSTLKRDLEEVNYSIKSTKESILIASELNKSLNFDNIDLINDSKKYLNDLYIQKNEILNQKRTLEEMIEIKNEITISLKRFDSFLKKVPEIQSISRIEKEGWAVYYSNKILTELFNSFNGLNGLIKFHKHYEKLYLNRNDVYGEGFRLFNSFSPEKSLEKIGIFPGANIQYRNYTTLEKIKRFFFS